jgi:DNA-binding beta-propeller fold protein YncE
MTSPVGAAPRCVLPMLAPSHRRGSESVDVPISQRKRLLALLTLAASVLAQGPAATPAVAATGEGVGVFESGQVRPLALSPDKSTLYAVNTPDDRLEIFDVSSGVLVHEASLTVGLEPVALAVRNDGEVWVVNHLSDSISIVDTSTQPPAVVRTLLVGDEPQDIVFAGEGRERAFITTAHRGQNSPYPRSEFGTPGVGRADVWVFDAVKKGVSLGGDPLAVVTLFGDKPRALAVSPDGRRVYAAVFRSGNQTTTVNDYFLCRGAGPCNRTAGIVSPGPLPSPRHNVEGFLGRNTGLIVKFEPDVAEWRDELGRNWNQMIRFSLPDLDVFALDATADPPVEVDAYAGVGTVLFNMVVNPVNGALYVSNTEAHNEVRFEGFGELSGSVKPPGEPASVRGRLHQARVTVIRGGAVEPRHLNKHIDYEADPDPGVKADSLSTPLGMAVSNDGETLYVAAFGSRKIGVFDTAELENDRFVPSASTHIDLGPGPVAGGGPSGLVLDEARQRLYALTRFDNSLVAIDLKTRAPIHRIPLHNPEPASVVAGRPFLYDARITSGNGEASCGTCHVFGDMDDLAWDLGDPDGVKLPNPNPAAAEIQGGEPFDQADFGPMKGPMTTQSLRGLANHGPMHWRGDRTGGNADPPGDPLDEAAAFRAFNGAFVGLIGRDAPLSEAEMEAFVEFGLQLRYPPSPIRRLGNSLRLDEAFGQSIFHRPNVFLGERACNFCHVLDPERGFFGTAGGGADFKVPHLRNQYQKVGMFGFPEHLFLPDVDNEHMGPQVRGFGYTHDGSVDTNLRFFRQGVFAMNELERRSMQAFVIAFDTGLAPIVGQQLTLTAVNAVVVEERLDLLLERANASECELVAGGRIGGVERGFAHLGGGVFRTDRAGEPPVGFAELQALPQQVGDALTFTCSPPGMGTTRGLDRDGDGAFDGDERRVGTDPANAGSVVGACDDGVDNDGDGWVDFPDDAGCASARATIENPGCSNVVDEDGDGTVDFPADSACATAADESEWRRDDLELDIVPGSPHNLVPMTRGGRIRLALLGSATVDVEQIDPNSLRFGLGAAAPQRVAKLRDANADGVTDLVAWFDTGESRLAASDSRACLSGRIASDPFRACDRISVRVRANGTPGSPRP